MMVQVRLIAFRVGLKLTLSGRGDASFVALSPNRVRAAKAMMDIRRDGFQEFIRPMTVERRLRASRW
jgi:hypothetical protein